MFKQESFLTSKNIREISLKIVSILFLNLFSNYAFADRLLKPELIINTERCSSSIVSISTDRENKYLLTTSNDNTLCVWDTQDGKVLKVFKIPTNEIIKLHRAQILDDGKTIVAVTSDGVYVFDTITQDIIKQIELLSVYRIHGYYYWLEIYFSENSEILAIYKLHDNTTNLYQTKTYKFLKTLDGKVFFSPTGEILSFDGKSVFIYDSNLKLKRKLRFKRFPDFLCFSPDGKLIAIGELLANNQKRFQLKIDIFSSKMRKITTIRYKTDDSIYRVFCSTNRNILYIVSGEFVFSNKAINKILKIDISKRQVVETLDLYRSGRIVDMIYLLKNNRFVAITDTPSILIFNISEINQ